MATDPRRNVPAATVAVALLVAALLTVYIASADQIGGVRDRDVSEESAAREGLDLGAYRECTELVAQRLADPTDATFPDPQQVNYSRSGDEWRISSYVDAENGLGALVRLNWACTLEATQRGWRGTATLVD